MLYLCERFSYRESSFGEPDVAQAINDWFQTVAADGWELCNFIPCWGGDTREIFVIMRKQK
jgi:hypothetical protein